MYHKEANESIPGVVSETEFDLEKRERKKKREAEKLDFQKHITETITNNVSSCLMTMNKKGRPTYLNPAAERATGTLWKQAQLYNYSD